MAFIDFQQAGASAPSLAASRAPTGFAADEWRIVQLARADGLASLREPGRLARLGAALFGGRPSRRLANERLEALRRLAVEAWHRGYAVSVSALETFNGAGFSAAQLEFLLAWISAARTSRGRGRHA